MKGSCLCQKIQFEAQPAKLEMGVCHCAMCRKWSGGTFMAVACDSIDVENATSLKAYDSSQWGERVFCADCGTTLMWRTKDHSQCMVSAQAFDEPDQFKFTGQIFIDKKPAHYEFSNQTNTMTESEVMAMFAPKPESH